MPVDLNISETKILTESGFIECGIAINEGKIQKIGKTVNLPKSSSTLNVKGTITLPGLIDTHVHLRDLELSYKEDFQSGTSAAAAGGFTTVLDMPNSKPPTNNPARLMEKKAQTENKILVDVGFYGAFPRIENEYKKMAELGVIGFKLNMYSPSTELNIDNDEVLIEALNKTAELNLPVAVHAEDRIIVNNMEEKLRKAGKNSTAAYLSARNPEAETTALNRILPLIKKTKVKAHISHVSLAESIKIIEEAKRNNLTLTCEATPHHLLLTEDELNRLGGIALTDPPLRSRSDAAQLLKKLNAGIIDIVASDHAPHSLNEKRKVNIWEIPPGIPGLETTLALMLTQVNEGTLSLRRVINALAEKPAEIFNLKKGYLNPMLNADLTIIDLKRKFKIDSSKFYSKAKYSPFDGWQVTGKPVKTFVAGELIMDDGEIVAKPGSGHIISVKSV
jgi:dihydroorotase